MNTYWTRRILMLVMLVGAVVSACGRTASESTATTIAAGTGGAPRVEQEVTFAFGQDELFGVLTLPNGEGPHPAIVLISGSGDRTDGIRAGASNSVFRSHSVRMAAEGFAVLRYDPPGVGRSSGGSVVPSFEARVEETITAIRYMQSLSDIASDEVGLQGWSQGPWIMAMTAAQYPEEVAFLVSVVGSGQSVANQQIYGIEAQTRAAGLPVDDITKAVVFGRALIDWQLIDPIYREANEADALTLGDGPWTDFMDLVYEPGEIDPVQGLGFGVEILKSVQGEPWTEALYLELQIPVFESIPADISVEQLAALAAISADNLMTDPKDFLTEIRMPVLAFFGEDDLNVDSDTSPALFEQYLTDAGNEDFAVVLIPGVGHGIGVSTPGYWDTLSDWLGHLYAD